MAHIEIERSHSLDHAQAREAAESVASHLNEEFKLRYEWDGDTLRFHRTGIQGALYVADNHVVVSARLGLLLRPLQGHFEKEIHRYLDELFDE
jgi:putative polyhydroxyalkanoate system protein